MSDQPSKQTRKDLLTDVLVDDIDLDMVVAAIKTLMGNEDGRESVRNDIVSASIPSIVQFLATIRYGRREEILAKEEFKDCREFTMASIHAWIQTKSDDFLLNSLNEVEEHTLKGLLESADELIILNMIYTELSRRSSDSIDDDTEWIISSDKDDPLHAEIEAFLSQPDVQQEISRIVAEENERWSLDGDTVWH